jgi:hypothetical protein
MDSSKYIEEILEINTENKDACLRFLTLFKGLYNQDDIKCIVEHSNYLLYITSHDNPVAFSLVRLRSKKKGKILDILLACAFHNYAKTIADSLCNYAVKYNYPFSYVSPRTPELRKTFIKYGFEPICGIEGINEVLEKEIDSP